jgi:hypothetical protein
LREIQEIVILVGFNSSVGQKEKDSENLFFKKQHITGYDISFIMYRSLY